MLRAILAYVKFFIGCFLVFIFLFPSVILCCGIILMKNSLEHNAVHSLVDGVADHIERFLDWFDNSI